VTQSGKGKIGSSEICAREISVPEVKFSQFYRAEVHPTKINDSMTIIHEWRLVPGLNALLEKFDVFWVSHF